MPIDLAFEQNAKGYYTIVSLMPHRAKIKGTLLFDGSANPSTATADGTLLDESSNNGGAATSPNTHEKSNVPDASTVPQSQQNVKENSDTTVGNKVEDSNEHAEQEPRAKYSRDAENQLDNQGEKTDNEGKKPTQPNIEFSNIHQRMKESIDDVLVRNILKDIKPSDDIGTALEKVIAPINREVDFQVAKYLEPGHNNVYYQTRLNMIHYFKQMVDEARRDFYGGLYVHRRIVGDNNVRNARRKGSGLRESIQARIQEINEAAETGEGTLISEHTRKTYENYNPKTRAVLQAMYEHPHENQNSRDVSAFYFAGNPLSE